MAFEERGVGQAGLCLCARLVMRPRVLCSAGRTLFTLGTGSCPSICAGTAKATSRRGYTVSRITPMTRPIIVDQLGSRQGRGRRSQQWRVDGHATRRAASRARGGDRDGRSSTVRDDHRSAAPVPRRWWQQWNKRDQEPRRRYIMDRMFLPTSDRRLVTCDTECDAGRAIPRGRLCHAGRARIRCALPSRRNARSPRSIWRRRQSAIHRHATRRI